MAIFLSRRELAETEPAERLAFQSPVPTRIVSNGEFNPLPQTERQRQFEARLKDLADARAGKLGMDRRQFLRTSCGMAAAFVALNDVFGPIFDVSAAEAAEPEAAAQRANGLSGQLTKRRKDTEAGMKANPTAADPETALRQLIDGNRRYTGARMTSFREDLRALRASTAEKQQPFAAVLSCADSRVPVELIFDQSIGRLFVTRIAGNIATSAIIASLEYAVAVLGVKAVLVMGHANCGAVKAAIEAGPVPGQISALYSYLRPAVDKAGPDLEAAIKANARMQAALLRQSSPVLADHTAQGQLKIVAGFYDLATGEVSLLE